MVSIRDEQAVEPAPEGTGTLVRVAVRPDCLDGMNERRRTMSTVATPPISNGQSQPSSPNFDVYVSCSNQDEEWCVELLIPELQRAGLKVIDKRDFAAKYKVRAREQAVHQSRHTILVLTPAWVEDQWGEFDAILTQSQDPASLTRRLIPLVVKRVDNIPERINAIQSLDYTHPESRRDVLERLLKIVNPSPQVLNEESTQKVVLGLVALAELMAYEATAGVVGAYKESFKKAVERIEVITRYKKLHDIFQAADGAFKLTIERRPRTAVIDVSVGEHFAGALEALIADLEVLYEYPALKGFTDDEVPWTGSVRLICLELTAFLVERKTDRLSRTLEQLQRVLGAELPRINQRIILLARELSLGTVAVDLQRVHDELSGQRSFNKDAQERLTKFGEGIKSLSQLVVTLGVLLANHNWLQNADDALRPFEGIRQPELNDLIGAWAYIKEPLSKLVPVVAGDWVVPLQRVASELDGTLQHLPTEAAGVRDVQARFNRLRREIDKAFNRADLDLLDLCGKLRNVGDSLQEAITRMQHGD
jgi:hypothetical protein